MSNEHTKELDQLCPWCALPPEIHNNNNLGLRYLGCPTKGCVGRDVGFIVDKRWNFRASVVALQRPPEQMTDDELRAAAAFHHSEAARFSNEGAKVWRLRVRMGHATDADKQRAAELEAARLSPVAPSPGQKAHYETAHDARYMMSHAVHPDIVVLWFLALKSHWFDDPKNMFFGMREQAKAYLYKWVETGELADDNTTLEIATAMKFREWLASSWSAAPPSTQASEQDVVYPCTVDYKTLVACLQTAEQVFRKPDEPKRLERFRRTKAKLFEQANTTQPSAEEIETRAGLLPLSLINEIQHRRETLYREFNHRHAAVASAMKTDLDFALAFLAVATFPSAQKHEVRLCLKCGHEERFSDNEGGKCEKSAWVWDDPNGGICGCICEFATADTTLDHRLDAAACMEKECVRVRTLLDTAGAPVVVPTSPVEDMLEVDLYGNPVTQTEVDWIWNKVQERVASDKSVNVLLRNVGPTPRLIVDHNQIYDALSRLLKT